MKAIGSLLMMLGVSLFSTVARADDFTFDSFYLQGGFGHVHLHRGNLPPVFDSTGEVDGSQTSHTLGFGWRINPEYALEVSYHDFGTVTDYFYRANSLSCTPGGPLSCGVLVENCPMTSSVPSYPCPKFTALSVEGVRTFPLAAGLNLELVAGLLRWRGDSAAGSLLGESSGNSLLYGVRLNHSFTDSVGLTLGYERSTMTTSEISLSLRFSFDRLW